MKRIRSLEKDEELDQAQWIAARGAARGAATWGMYGGIAGLAAYWYSPVYRGLTLQFKVYLQMSAMLLGGMIHADRSMQGFEHHRRHTNRIERDAEVWRRYEQDYAAEQSRNVRMGNQKPKEPTPKPSEQVNEETK